MDPKLEKYPFSTDRPIQNAGQDRLGRTAFAEALANAITSWRGKDSLVIALYGPWGSGKSSIKNLALERLRSSGATSPKILNFDPWQLADENQMTHSFFSDLGTIIGRSDTSTHARQIAIKFHSYARYLSTGSFVFEGIKKIFVAVLLIIGSLGLAGTFFLPHLFLVLMTLFSFFVAGAFSWSSKLFGSIATSFQAESEAKLQTLSEQKNELASLLHSHGSPILIVIDDVDRLTIDELKVLFQLVKANADFPGLVYLLLMNREHVEANLASLGGREYMAKIVQVGFEMPKADRLHLESLLISEMAEIMMAHGLMEAFESEKERWRNIYTAGAGKYFSNLRDIRRFLSVFAFQTSNFSGASRPEINIVDLAAIQVLAVFEPQLYQALYSAKRFVTGDQKFYPDDVQSGEAGVEQRNLLLQELLSHVPEERVKQVTGMLRELFPPLNFTPFGFVRGRESESDQIQKLRVCNAGFFDRYFLLSIPDRDISQVELHHILSLTKEPALFAKTIIGISQRGLFDLLFERLTAHLDKFDSGNLVPMLIALFDAGDSLPDVDTSYYISLPEERIAQLAADLLGREPDSGIRQHAYLAALGATIGIYVPLLTYTKVFHGAPDNSPQTLQNRIAEAQRLLLAKISDYAGQGKLRNHKRLVHILHYWIGVAPSDSEVRQWIDELTEAPDGLIVLLRGMTSDVTTASEQLRQTNLKSMEKFIALEKLYRRMTAMSSDAFSDADKTFVAAWGKAISEVGNHGDVTF